MSTKANGAAGNGAAANVGDVENTDTITETKNAAQVSWRDVLPVHPAAAMSPMMAETELRELGEDIAKNGLITPIIVLVKVKAAAAGRGMIKEYSLLDGRNRLDAIELVGVRPVRVGKPPRGLRYDCGLAGDLSIEGQIHQAIRYEFVDDPWSYGVSANIHRRHLTADQKRDLITKLIKADPGKSDRQIAEIVKASPTTVGTVRSKMEAAGDVSKLDTRTDSKGRLQPANKPKAEAAPAVDTVAELVPKSRIASAPAPAILSQSDKALAEFKVAVSTWFAKMEYAAKRHALLYVIASCPSEIIESMGAADMCAGSPAAPV